LMAKKPCARVGCVALVDRGYCAEHQASAPARVAEERRGSSWKRGYDGAWLRFRKWFLNRHPVCEDCGRLATEPHHIKKVKEYLELRLVEINCKALCHDCHSKRTARGE
jgi:5-methylcytosine-specific restriction enzyme A